MSGAIIIVDTKTWYIYLLVAKRSRNGEYIRSQLETPKLNYEKTESKRQRQEEKDKAFHC